jgi:hypothetical protein
VHSKPVVFFLACSNKGGVRDSYLALVEHLAGAFQSRPSVIGFDLLNEPLGDEVLHVSPLYAEAALRVRRANSSALILTTPQFLVGSGFVATRLVPPAVDHAVFSPHFYNFLSEAPIVAATMPLVAQVLATPARTFALAGRVV